MGLMCALCSSSRGRMRLGLHISHSYWSRSISLEAIGMPTAAFVLAPASRASPGAMVTQSRAVEGLQMLGASVPVRQALEQNLTGCTHQD